MVTAARDRLARTLRGDVSSAFSAGLTARLDDLSLELDGLGRVKFPVTPATARKLIGLGQPARFGRGEETLIDPNVRHTWEIPTHLVNVNWGDAVLKETLLTIKEELGLPNAAELTAELHSFLVYEPDQFFLAHQDSEKSDDMVGTLVVTLPSRYTGGELIVEHGGERTIHQGSTSGLSLVAFYADCRHEVLKVKSGYRITLTYNLLLQECPNQPKGAEGTVAELVEFLREHFSTPAPRYFHGPLAEPPNRLVFLLDHEYTPRALNWSRLKGNDASRVSLLREAAKNADCEAFLALADIQETHEAFEADDEWEHRGRSWYDEYDEDEDDDAPDAGGSDEYQIHDLIESVIRLTHWTGQDGAGLDEISLQVAEAQACASTPSGDLRPYSQEYEGYMGNWGNTLDRWYHRAAVVVWPRNRAFANRAEMSPAWALDELAAMASAGDVAAARTAAATLAPFWTGAWNDDALFGKALRAAELVADAASATLLLRPFRIGGLTKGYASPFARLAESYGQDWTADQLRSWFGGNEPRRAYGYGHEVEQWAAGQLPDLCRALHACGGTGSAAAHQLLDLAWTWISRSIGSALAMSPPSHRAGQLNELGKPLAAVLAAATIAGSASTRDLATAFIGRQDDTVTSLELSGLRAAVELPRYNAVADEGLRVLAEDCAERLRVRLARPIRDAGDWSIEPPATDCPCKLCGILDEFLAARNRRSLEWPLAKDGRQHIHSRIDRAELPVTHITRRQGRPYTLVLGKTDALVTGEQEARVRDEADLAWLAETWTIASWPAVT